MFQSKGQRPYQLVGGTSGICVSEAIIGIELSNEHRAEYTFRDDGRHQQAREKVRWDIARTALMQY